MRKRILFLDDNKDRHEAFRDRMHEHEVLSVFTTRSAITALDYGPPYDVVYLDHDLGEIDDVEPYAERTGCIVAKHIATKLSPNRRPRRVIIHSWNLDGSKRMRDILQNAGLDVSLAPF